MASQDCWDAYEPGQTPANNGQGYVLDWMSLSADETPSVRCCLPRSARGIEALLESHGGLRRARRLGARGWLRIEGADYAAGFSNIWVMQPVNTVLLAERHCLLPHASFSPRGTLTYKGAEWEWIFEPLPRLTRATRRALVELPTYAVLDPRENNLGKAWNAMKRASWTVCC